MLDPIVKQGTYLNSFEQTSKVQYTFVAKARWLLWLVLYMVNLLTQFAIAFPIQIVFGVVLTIKLMGGVDLSNDPWFTWLMYLMSTGATIFSFFILVKWIEKRPFHTIGLRCPNRLKKYLKGALLAILMQLTYYLIVFVMGYAEIESFTLTSADGSGKNVLMFVVLYLIMFMVQGASEEIAVRGWLLPVLSNYYRVSVAIILSAMFFAILHLFNPNFAWLPMLNLVLYGIFAALYALYDEGLWGIFAHHSIWNWFMGNVLGLPVSGMILGGQSLLITRVAGPALITGADFGPEGGLIVTLMLGTASVWLVRKLHLKQREERKAFEEIS